MTTDKHTPAMFSRRQLIQNAVLGIGAGALASFLPAAPAEAQFGDFSLDSLLKPQREKYDVPALAAAILTNETILIGAVGVRRYDLPAIKVTHNDQFHLGSCTKAMTATLIGMLIEQKTVIPGTGSALTWKTKISQIFPEFQFTMNPAYNNITVDHLLAHCSGFSDASMPADPAVTQVILISIPPNSRHLYTGAVLGESPVVAPGQFHYSNRNYTVLGAIIERMTNQIWEVCITQRLFTPLGMTSAGFGPMGTNLVDQPWQHLFSAAINQHLPIAPMPWSDNPEVIGPAGTVHCSALHWMRFVQEHYHGLNGKGKLMQQATYQRLHAPQFAGSSYAGGWGQQGMFWSNSVYFHAGSNNQNYAIVMLSPIKKFAVIVMTNQGGVEAQAACDNTGTALVKWAQQVGILT